MSPSFFASAFELFVRFSFITVSSRVTVFFSLIIFLIIYCSAVRLFSRKTLWITVLFCELSIVSFCGDTLFSTFRECLLVNCEMLDMLLEIDEALDLFLDLERLLFSGTFSFSALISPWKVSLFVFLSALFCMFKYLNSITILYSINSSQFSWLLVATAHAILIDKIVFPKSTF